ncbi:IS4 family transposase, partial [Parendozoicomonas sp. Alg238-R29]|uniref:IS4 family transposase n=1 Tax=Parendozoicomonas sp. Alg238-R29 TaxID=2993446 RepID=UPI00248F21C4
MRSNSKQAFRQQQRLQTYAASTTVDTFCRLLETPDMATTLPAHRERIYPPIKTLSMFMAQALGTDRSCQNAVNNLAVHKAVQHSQPVSTSTGGYCQARMRLPVSLISNLVSQSGDLMDQQVREAWRWRNRRVRLIDGTTVSMQDTARNQEKYPQSGTQKPGLGFPVCRVLGVICLSSGAVLNAAIGPCKGKGSDEQSLLRKVFPTFQTGDLVLGDAFFGTFFLLASLVANGMDGVFEQMGVRRRGTDFQKGQSLGSKDHIIQLTKPAKKPDWITQQDYDSAPNELAIRELHTGGRTLITTLLCPKIAPKGELKKLYKKRWQIEVDFR